MLLLLLLLLPSPDRHLARTLIGSKSSESSRGCRVENCVFHVPGASRMTGARGVMCLPSDTTICYHLAMKRHQRTLELIYARPGSANVRWADIEALLIELGGQISEREGSRVLVRLFNERRVFHRPHPEPTTD